MELNLGYPVVEKLISENTSLKQNTCLVLEIKDEMQSILVESLLWGKKIGLLDAFWIACKSLDIEIG